MGSKTHAGQKLEAQMARLRASPLPWDRRLVNICQRRKARKAVLLAIGKVKKSGGAPGPYKKPIRIKCD